MRQAGRYLPEYRAVRARAGSFLDLCYTPALAAEVTLQPIRRYGFDAAILFSDILVVPDALGQGVAFVEGEGPRLEPVRSAADLGRLNGSATRPKFGRVCETVARLRQDLPHETALIGFCGAPWTVATYMVAGQGSTDQADARLWAYRDPQRFPAADRSAGRGFGRVSRQAGRGRRRCPADFRHLGRQPAGGRVRALGGGADARRIVERLKAGIRTSPIIGFPRGAGMQAVALCRATGVEGVSCDTAMPLGFMADELAQTAVVAGQPRSRCCWSPAATALERRVQEILAAMAGERFIFNLGHGIVPETPPEHVARLVELVRRRARLGAPGPSGARARDRAARSGPGIR